MKGIELINNNVRTSKEVNYFNELKFELKDKQLVAESTAAIWATDELSDADIDWLRSDIPDNVTGLFYTVGDVPRKDDECCLLSIDEIDNDYLSAESSAARKNHGEWFRTYRLYFKSVKKDWKPDWKVSDKSDIVILDSGDFYIKDYGKYKSGLGLIISKNDKHYVCCPIQGIIKLYNYSVMKKADLNLGNGSVEYMVGDYFVSKKGTKIFKVKDGGKHLLLRDHWGGCFNDYRGGKLPKEDDGALYYRRASSNGGGAGYDYAVVPVGWRNKLTEEDL